MAEADDRSRIKSILGEAFELPSAERAAYLDRACGNDNALRKEVESLLDHLDATVNIESEQPAGPTPPPSRAGVAPKRIGSYTIITKLGEGGMGVVYKATQDFPRRTVALKVIKPQMASPRILERFRFETQVLAKLTHAGIAQIYDAGMTETPDGEQPYFAMELVRGRPLLEYARLRNLTFRERLALVQRIAEAVHHAHTRGVVHRDLKPGNILVTEDGTPKILDFGVARSIGGDVGLTSQRTEIGQLVGTLPYMSPEQVAGDPDELDARSDVYSLGIVMYELLSGGLPYELEKKVLQEAMRVIQEVEPTRLSQISKVYRGDVETIVGKALLKDRTRRYQSASELASDIFRFLNDEPITARPPSAMYQVRKFAKRHRVIAAGAGVAALGMTGGLTLAVWQLGQTRAARDELREANSELQSALTSVSAERDRAEAVIDQLDDLTDVLLEYERASRRLVGSISSRRVLAANARDTLLELRRVSGDTPWVRSKLAHAFARLGTISWLDAASSDQAIADFQAAIELHRQELAERPGDSAHADGLCLSLASLASLTVMQGATQPALAMVLEAEGILQAMDEPDALTTARVGRAKAGVLREQGRDEEAIEELSLAAELLEGDASLDGQDFRALVLADQAEVLSRNRSFDRATEVIEFAIAIRRNLITQHPTDAVVKRRMITLLNVAAENRERQGDAAGGLALHQELFQLASELAELDADDDLARASTRKSLHSLARAFERNGQRDEAIRSASAFLEASRAAAERSPTDLALLHDVAHAYELRGDMTRRHSAPDESDAEAIERLESAINDFVEARGTLKWMRSMTPGRAEWHRDEARVALKAAHAAAASMAHIEEAEQQAAVERLIGAYENATRLYTALLDDELADETSSRLAARCVRSLGMLYLDDGRPAEAYELFERADGIRAMRLAHVAFAKARAAAELGRLDEARTHHEAALEWSRAGRSRYSDDAAKRAELAEIEAFVIPGD